MHHEGLYAYRRLVADAEGWFSACLWCVGVFGNVRYRTHPQPCLENPENGRRESLPLKDDVSDTSRPVFGVITYIINDARSGEFDDCPVM